MTSERVRIENRINFTKPISELLKNLEEINGNEITIYYENETYDGPEEGVCIWNDKKYYFKFFQWIIRDKKTFFLIRLNDEELAYDRDIFMQLIQSKNIGDQYKIINLYPDKYFGEEQIVGWFQLGVDDAKYDPEFASLFN